MVAVRRPAASLNDLRLAGLERVLAISRVSQHVSLTFLPAGMVYSEQAHRLSIRHLRRLLHPPVPSPRDLGSLLRLIDEGPAQRYSPSDCFETFPFPDGWETDPTLEAAGQAYYEFRASLMVRNDEG